MRDCPSCGRPVDGLSCAHCGFSDNQRGKGSGDEQRTVKCWNRDHTNYVLAHHCSDVSFGQQCARPGTISPSTRGGGPWYCADHFPAFRGAGKNASPPPQGFGALKELLRPIEKRVIDHEAAAEREALQTEEAP